jgi:hypothetical protein
MIRHFCRTSLLLLVALSAFANGLITQPYRLPSTRRKHGNFLVPSMTINNRRQILVQLVTAAPGGMALIAATHSATPASAVVTSEGLADIIFNPGQVLSTQEAKQRFVLARQDVRYLLENYADICKGKGDAVRRYLGTVGVTSGMYGISKVLKDLQDQADDIVEYTDAMEEFNAYLYQAEGAAYQSLFVEHSSAKGTPESLLATAKQDVIQMEKYMDLLAVQLHL